MSFWPEPVEYAEAIQSPQISFSDRELQAASAEMGVLGPSVCSGNFASVYHLVTADGGRGWAIKCFSRRVSGQQERYRRISQHIEQAALPFAVNFQYQDRGIRIRGEWFPILKMDWVEGQSLSEFVDRNCEDHKYIGRLYRIWLRLEPYLHNTRTVHGDLQHGNVLLVPAQDQGKLSLRLIDYDGLWTPQLAQSPSGEAGHAAYQHPDRLRRGLYTPEMDRFPHLVIGAALRCLSRPHHSHLWKRYYNGDNFLFKKQDFDNPGSSELLHQLWDSRFPDIRTLAGLIAMAAAASFEATPRFEDRLVDRKLAELTPEEQERASELLGPSNSYRRLRNPWSAAMKCLEAYAQTPDLTVLERAEQYALAALEGTSMTRFWQEALRRNIAPHHYRGAMIESVSSTSQTVCPECWECITPEEIPASNVRIDQKGDVHSDVISVHQVELHGIWYGVDITPWSGAPPPWKLSTPGAIVAVGVLFLVPCAFFALMVLAGYTQARSSAVGTFLVGLSGMLVVALSYRTRSVEPLNVAWTTVVPELLKGSGTLLRDHADFIAGLAVVTPGRGDAGLREAVVQNAIATISHLVRKGQLPPHHVGQLLRLRWNDALRHGDVHGECEYVLNEMLKMLVDGRIPACCLDDATANGKSLKWLRDEEPIAIVWRLVEDAKLAALSPADLGSLVTSSQTLVELMKVASVPVAALPHFFAMLDLEDAKRIPQSLVTARQLLAARKYHLFRDYPTLLAQTAPARSAAADSWTVRLLVDCMVFADRLFTNSPKVDVISNVEFVQTGWTHQKKDGGPDLRFADNQPTGHYEEAGFALLVGPLKILHTDEPTQLARDISHLSSFQFNDVIPFALDLALLPTTARSGRILEAPPSRCPRCQCQLRARPGTVADRIVETEFDLSP